MADTKSLTLREKNVIYQQRYRERLRIKLGDEEYKRQHNKAVQEYREQRYKDEGYVKPEPVKPIVRPRNVPEPKKEIVLQPIKENKKQTNKEINKWQLQKLALKSTTLSDKAVSDYSSKNMVMYQLFTGETLSGAWKQEIIKALKGQTYDEGLVDVLSYFNIDTLQDAIYALREEYTRDNSFKAYINAITGLIGRMDGFDKSYEYISSVGSNLQLLYTEQRDKNEISQEDYDKIQLIKFDDKSIAKNIKKIKNLRDKALYAIYIYVPRRLEVRTLQIRKNTKNTNKGNYLILSTEGELPEKFIFNDYKTASSYHKQTVQVPEEVRPILHEYILESDFKSDDFLFSLARSKREPLEESAFSSYFSRVFQEVYGANITNQLLRSAYATYFTTRAKTVTEKKEISARLSHDYLTNEQYIKLVVKKE